MLAFQPGSSSSLSPLSDMKTQRMKNRRSRLVISPDLDALLEHEERVRGNGIEVGSGPVLQSPVPSPSSPNSAGNHVAANGFPVGLPPPPRGERARQKRGKTMGEGQEKTGTLIVSERRQQSIDVYDIRGSLNYSHGFGSMCSSSTNPYINPAPKLEELPLMREKTERKIVAHLRATINSSGNSRCYTEHEVSGSNLNGGEDLVDNAETRGCDGGAFASVQPSASFPTDGKRRRRDKARRLKKRPHTATEGKATIGQEGSPTSLVKWKGAVDQQLNSCEIVGDLFQENVPGTSRWDGRHKRGLSYSIPIPHLASARQPERNSRLKQATTKHGAAVSAVSATTTTADRTMSRQNVTDDIPVLDIRRRHSTDFLDITNEGGEHSSVWRRQRPSNSHVVDSRRTTISNDSGSNVERSEPPPAGKRHRQPGLNITLANHANPEGDETPEAVYSLAEDKSKADRESFIEFFSPTSPAFNRPSPETSTLMPLTSKSQFSSHRMPSRPKSPGTKPIFSIPAFKSSSSSSSSSRPPSRSASPLLTLGTGDGRDALPPLTTNFLDTGERAELVRKSRKLTRLFGETPVGEMITPSEPVSIGRRRSVPATPTELSQTVVRTSFIDLSDGEEDGGDHDQMYPDHGRLSPIIFAPNPAGTPRPRSPSVVSLAESTISPEQRAEDERRRKRERLAKLHRYLGSRVPADLVLGVDHLQASLPPVQPFSMPSDNDSDRKLWLRRRRSSSAGDLPSWSDDVDRMKEELNDKEKAINVRRAQKMEKMFGVAPPQTLYHTRHSPSPSVPNSIFLKRAKSPPRPSFGDFVPPGTVPSPTYQQRNPNRTSYLKAKHKRNARPGTAESSMRLLPEGQNCYDYDDTPAPRTSLIFSHYQHSLKSLSDILDRDDKESLAELHQYLNDYEDTNLPPSPHRDNYFPKDRRLSNASSIRSERRRSLPARTSISSTLSVTSDLSTIVNKPEVTDFQLRRRRAAKLTQFFGVNYRELINDVLESLEHGLEHERKRGTLRAEEVEDLLERLRKIKTKRKGFF